MADYDHKKIEPKWQEKWREKKLYRTPDSVSGKENFYTLVEFPYPSGDLHIGHWYAYGVPDIFARMKRMQGKNVLFPFGFDAFGLPAENAAIKHNVSPKTWTQENIEKMRTQMLSMGNSFDWEREITTSDPAYYRWTQWLFLKFYEKGLAYRGKALVNWDPLDQTVLANEQVLPDGTAERSGATVEKKELTQWFFKITDYAERLLSDLDELPWPESIKESQRNWIGKSEGANIRFRIQDSGSKKEIAEVEVFTTRPDTLFGATYMVLAPEHPLVAKLADTTVNCSDVLHYITESTRKSEMERQENKEKTGVELKGIKAINPATKKEIPIFVADYVLSGYGTGAIMAVPAHDERDNEFAKKFNLPIRVVVKHKGDYEGMSHQANLIALKQVAELSQKEDFELLLVGGFAKTLRDKKDRINSDIDIYVDAKGWKILNAYFRKEKYSIETHENSFGWKNCVAFYNNKTWVDIFLLEKKEGKYFDSISGNTFELGDGKDVEMVDVEGVSVKVAKENLLENIYQHHAITAKVSCFTGPGLLNNSGQFDGLSSEEAKKKITEFVGGKMTTRYKFRDWLISRQRYWGAPIPIVYDPEGNPHPVPEKYLPWLLPADADIKPKGASPLGSSKELKERTERLFGKGWTPETDTMDGFVDNSWYFLRYLDPANDEQFSSLEKQKTWMPIARYSGGAEHTTVHVLYSRFFIKALFDMGLATEKEPYRERLNRGIILAEDGRKMSKRWGNVVNPDKEVERVGADSVRTYLAFIGPYNEVGSFPWSTNGLVGVRRFLERVWALAEMVGAGTLAPTLETLLHQTIKKVEDDIETMKFNTSVSALMILSNELQKADTVPQEVFETFLKLVAPFAPHMTEELWERLGHGTSIHLEPWPAYDPKKALSESAAVAVQINGKTRGIVSIARDATEDAVVEALKQDERLSKYIDFKPRKVIFVPNRVINFLT